jgi:hypothetical protein
MSQCKNCPNAGGAVVKNNFCQNANRRALARKRTNWENKNNFENMTNKQRQEKDMK